MLPPWAPIALQGGKMLIDGVSNIMHNLAVMKTGQGTPAAPEPVALEPAEPAQPPSPEEQQMQLKKMYAEMAHKPLIEALEHGVPGFRFGGWIMTQTFRPPMLPGVSVEGTAVYEFLASAGREGIMDILQSSPQVWRDVQRYGNQMEQFLTEFLMVDEARRSAQDLLRAAASGPMIVPPPAPLLPLAQRGRKAVW